MIPTISEVSHWLGDAYTKATPAELTQDNDFLKGYSVQVDAHGQY